MSHTDTIKTEKVPLQTRGPYSDNPYRRYVISTDKGPLQTKDPYMICMQGCKGLLQTRAPSCKQEPLHYIQTRAPYRYAGRP